MGKIYGCFRAEPVKKGAPKTNMKKHCKATEEYAKDQRDRQVKAYGYSYVEPQNVRYNKVLVDCGDKSYDEIIKECNREKFGGRTIRKDGIPMLDTVFYYSPEKTKNLLCYLHRNNAHWKKENAEWWEAYKSLPKAERQEKINEEYRWVCDWAKASEEWAEKNLGQVVHCVLHCHEGTPHLDCKTLAIKEKEGGKWIWAKREILGNSAHLHTMQTKYAEECGSKFGLERGEVHEKGALRKHAETERHMAAEARRDLQSEIAELQEIKAATVNHIKQQDSQIEANEKILSDQKQEAEEIYKPFIDAQERLLEQFEKLTPKQQAKERTTIEELLKESKRAPFGDPDKMRKATAALKKESERIEADYFSVDSDEDFGLD